MGSFLCWHYCPAIPASPPPPMLISFTASLPFLLGSIILLSTQTLYGDRFLPLGTLTSFIRGVVLSNYSLPRPVGFMAAALAIHLIQARSLILSILFLQIYFGYLHLIPIPFFFFFGYCVGIISVWRGTSKAVVSSSLLTRAGSGMINVILLGHEFHKM